MTSSLQLQRDFSKSTASKSKATKAKKKRLPPLSIRLSSDEYSQLYYLAGDMPVSTYVKRCLFAAANDNKPPKTRKKAIVEDKQLLAKILGMLSKLDIFMTIKALLEAVQHSSLKLKPETERALQKACRDISDIRRYVISALGIKAE